MGWLAERATGTVKPMAKETGFEMPLAMSSRMRVVPLFLRMLWLQPSLAWQCVCSDRLLNNFYSQSVARPPPALLAPKEFSCLPTLGRNRPVPLTVLPALLSELLRFSFLDRLAI